MFGFILIHKDDLFSIKIEIYYQIMRIITKNICNYKPINITNKVWFFYLVLKTLSWLDIFSIKDYSNKKPINNMCK